MAAPLTCPGCWCSVTVPPGHRGATLTCPICRADVTISGAAPAPAVAKAPPASPAGPSGATPSAPVPVAVARAVAKPSAPPTAAPKDKPKPAGIDWSETGADDKPARKKPARDDDDDDSPGPRKLPPAVIVGGLGALMLMFCVLPVGGFIWAWSRLDEAEVAEATPRPATAPAVPPVRPFPQQTPRPAQQWFPQPGGPAWDANWTPMPLMDGVRAEFPPPSLISVPGAPTGSTTAGGLTARFGGQSLRGRMVSITHPTSGVLLHAAFVDVPAGLTLSAADAVRAIHGQEIELTDGPNPVTLGATPADEFTASRSRYTTGPTTIRVARVGPRAYVFLAGPVSGPPPASGTREDRYRKFFDSVVITFDANTPPPPSRPRTDFPTPPPTPDPFQPRPVPPVMPNPVARPMGLPAPKLLATLPAFTTAVALPERKEMLTFAPRTGAGGKLLGTMNRYSLPDFKPLGSTNLPAVVVYAAADETGGRLVTAAATAPDPFGIGDGAGRSVTSANVLVFDLPKLLDGSGKDLPDAKPTATVPMPPQSRVTGLELSPDGKTAYVGTLLPQQILGGRVFTWKGAVQQVATVAGRLGTPLEMPGPIGPVRLAPDGKRLFVLGHQYFPPLAPATIKFGFGHPAGTKLWVVDPVAGRVTGDIDIRGSGSDLVPTPDGRLLVVVPQTVGRGRLLFVEPDDRKSDDITPVGDGLDRAFTAALSPDGKRLILGSMTVTDGIMVFAANGLRPGGLTATAKAAKYDGRPVAGQMHLTPDGKAAVFHTGQVISLTDTDGPPEQ